MASLPMLNMTGKSSLLGNRLSHVQIIENRMISIMDGIPQDDGDSPGEDRDGDSPGEDRDGDSPEVRDGDSPG